MEEKAGATENEESDHESEEDESEILEESPCGRWLKRSEEVSQRNVPGIDRAYLAMDSEEGVEVVWNEVQFSERKSFKQQEEKIKAVFDNLTRIDHANIVKFHRYWIDYQKEQQKTRVVFITEYMSSGSVKEFLNKTKDIQKYKRTKSWKRWCTQILSALSYLHNCTPPVIHGNMTCDTIFIQHNGLVKIGSVAPDAIRNHVKTYHEVKRNMHYYAPEYGAGRGITPAVDIYSFGICALEMAVPRTKLHYRESKSVSDADIESAIDILEDPNQRDFIRLCLRKDPTKRPSARSLLLHPLLFEVHSLKLLAAHAFVKNQRILPEYKQKELTKDMVIATLSSSNPKSIMLKDVPAFDIDKFLEDVKNGVYPLTSFSLPKPPWAASHPSKPSQAKGKVAEGHVSIDQAEEIPETRKIVFAQGSLTPMEKGYGLILQLRFEDKMNRHLNCDVQLQESADTLSSELAQHRLIKENDKEMIRQLLADGLKKVRLSKAPEHFSTGKNLLGNERVEDIPTVIGSSVQTTVTSSPVTDGNYRLVYSNQQTQIQAAVQVPLTNAVIGSNPIGSQIASHYQPLPTQPVINSQLPIASSVFPVSVSLQNTYPQQQAALLQQASIQQQATFQQQPSNLQHGTIQHQTGILQQGTAQQQAAPVIQHSTVQQQASLLPHGTQQQQPTLLPQGNIQPQVGLQQYQQPQLSQFNMQQLQQQLTYSNLGAGSHVAQQPYLMQQPQQPAIPLQQTQYQYAQHPQFLQQNMPNLTQQPLAVQQPNQQQLGIQPQVVQQSLYMQQQATRIQQPQTQVLQQSQPPMLQRHVHFQANPSQIQPYGQNQAQMVQHMMQVQQPAIPGTQTVGQVMPVMHYNQAGNPVHVQQQQPIATQPPSNQNLVQHVPPTTIPGHQQQVRMAGQQNHTANLQRSGSFYTHHQPLPQSSNNSNNIIFSRSNSRVDEVTYPIGMITGQQVMPMQQTTPHSSSTSGSSSMSDHEMVGNVMSPQSSGQILLQNGGGDTAHLKMA